MTLMNGLIFCLLFQLGVDVDQKEQSDEVGCCEHGKTVGAGDRVW